MTDVLTPFEQSLGDLTRQLVAEYRPHVAEAGLEATFDGVSVRDARLETRCSEVTVTFRKGKNVVDVFEFFAERDGSPHVTLAQAEQWLRRELTDLPRRHAHHSSLEP